MNLNTKNTGSITRGYLLKRKIPIIVNYSIAELTRLNSSGETSIIIRSFSYSKSKNKCISKLNINDKLVTNLTDICRPNGF